MRVPLRYDSDDRAVNTPVVIALMLLCGVLLVFSQTGAVHDGDEGLHLVAASLVQAGQRPFVDFFYWHEPLYLYVVSSWMAAAGASWRSVHVLSALLTAVAALLIGSYTPAYLRAMRAPAWWGIVAALCFALNVLVLKWGTIGHNYGLCLLLSVVAYRFAVSAVDRPGHSRAVLAGLCAGGAAATSPLVVFLVPVMLLWLVLSNRAGSRWTKAASFGVSAMVPFTPLILLALAAPDETYFGLVEHHLTFRVRTSDAAAVHVETLSSWMTSPQALLLILLAGTGTVAVGRAAPTETRRDVYLCGALVLVLGAFVSLAHPPARPPYFVVLTPFVAILASIGAFAIAQRIDPPRGRLVASTVVALLALGAARSIQRERLWSSEWKRIEAFAEEVNRVSAPGGSFYSSYPFVYFAAGRLPPEGLENNWATRMTLSLDSFARLEVMPEARLIERVRSGSFDAALLRRGDPRYESATMDRLYRESKLLDQYYVLRWDRRGSNSGATGGSIPQER